MSFVTWWGLIQDMYSESLQTHRLFVLLQDSLSACLVTLCVVYFGFLVLVSWLACLSLPYRVPLLGRYGYGHEVVALYSWTRDGTVF